MNEMEATQCDIHMLLDNMFKARLEKKKCEESCMVRNQVLGNLYNAPNA